jgi:hypothetical protein
LSRYAEGRSECLRGARLDDDQIDFMFDEIARYQNMIAADFRCISNARFKMSQPFSSQPIADAARFRSS